MSTIITGMEWILENLEQPAVVLMSIGGEATLLLDQACQSLVNAGATVVVAAGNDHNGRYSLCTTPTLTESCLWPENEALCSARCMQCCIMPHAMWCKCMAWQCNWML